MSSWKAWIHAARLRTLPLALACVLMGGSLAYADGEINGTAFFLAIVTTIILQILSNFANDYGDYSSGVDMEGRIGPVRAMQGGHINQRQMQNGIIFMSILAFLCGVCLLLVANIPFGSKILFLVIGIAAIIAAITYTVGKHPYGYAGLGDLSVFIFFGLAGVLGSHFVIHGHFYYRNVLLAATCGLFCVGVLNLNNIRDLMADKMHNKNTIPVSVGGQNAKKYHIALIGTGWILAVAYTIIHYLHWTQWLMFLALPLFVWNVYSLWTRDAHKIDPLLKQLALSTLVFVLLNGLGWILA